MNELFNCLYLGREKGLDVKVIVNDRVIPIIVTNMETSSLSYEQRIKIKLGPMSILWTKKVERLCCFF